MFKVSPGVFFFFFFGAFVKNLDPLHGWICGYANIRDNNRKPKTDKPVSFSVQITETDNRSFWTGYFGFN